MTSRPGLTGRRGVVWPSAHTGLLGVIGHPISHSLSPIMMNAALEACDIDATLLAFDVEARDLVNAFQALRVMNVTGLMVTMPHKASMLDLVDTLTPRASLLGSVNVVYRSEGLLVGDSTDGAGFVRFLSGLLGEQFARKSVGIVGCGGAGRSLIAALVSEGVRVVVANRTTDAAVRFASQLDGGFSVVSSPSELCGVDIVVNATPMGMIGSQYEELDLLGDDVLGAAELYVDIVYHPLVTSTMKRAQALGTPAFNGVGMLVGLGALCFELFFNRPAPFEAMRRAVDATLNEAS